ncbi:SpoIID/LytB domain-containing protein [Bacillus sp. RO2]|uniref:SpoIID/LytB domain-containing protein n=1 Tax=Bacillus sp. RO2 TaxID=2723913 RepID=UPI00145CD36C|nr:SpoIID/LytB domain-containing protein [Bacillus sp. RO2]NMH75161.1 SpoIID/LytB domain-containing protein [Bacillus sp. RO2]
MNKIKFLLASTLALLLFFSPGFTSIGSASTISIKLQNYIGNKTEIQVNTTGQYKLENGNVRLSGADRFEVAANIASSGWNVSDAVFIVSQEAYADALSTAPFAYAKNAPILLTRHHSIPDTTINKLRELKAKEIIVIGGTSSVSNTVFNQLKGFTSKVSRVNGADRYEVAKNIATLLGSSTQAIVVGGNAYADALSIAPYAAVNKVPILLTKDKSIPAPTSAALKGKTKVTVIGGPTSVSQQVYNQLPGTKSRIGGADRYEVSANIIKTLNLDASEVYLSNGEKYADAFTGAVLAAKNNRPLLLTKATTIPSSVQTIIDTKNTGSFTILGGPHSVTREVENQLPNELYLESSKTYKVQNNNGRLGLYEGTKLLKDFGNANFNMIPERYNESNVIELNNRPYLGKIEFHIENGFVRPYNRNIPFDDYLKGVVPAEMPASWEMEALKAQSVAARTYSYGTIGTTINDTQGFQVYRGYEWHVNTNNAIEATKGEILTYNGNPIGQNAVFSSSNGGYTESNSNLWGGTQIAYLKAKPDSLDSSYQGWNLTLNKLQLDVNNLDLKNPTTWWNGTQEVQASSMTGLKKWLSDNHHNNSEFKIVGIKNIEPQNVNSSKRNKDTKIEIEYFVRDLSKGFVKEADGTLKKHTISQTITANAFRTMFGTMNIKSTMYQVETTEKTLKVVGNGFGHGVGMSQHGAQSRAKAGHTYKQILDFYYNGTNVTKK